MLALRKWEKWEVVITIECGMNVLQARIKSMNDLTMQTATVTDWLETRYDLIP